MQLQFLAPVEFCSAVERLQFLTWAEFSFIYIYIQFFLLCEIHLKAQIT